MLDKFFKGLKNPNKIPSFIRRTLLINIYKLSGLPVRSRGLKVPIDLEINGRYISSYVDRRYEKLEVDACYDICMKLMI